MGKAQIDRDHLGRLCLKLEIVASYTIVVSMKWKVVSRNLAKNVCK